MTQLILKDLTFSYSNLNHLTSPINAKFPKGSIVAIVGINGIGKSSLLKVIAKQISGELSYSGSINLKTTLLTSSLITHDLITVSYYPQEQYLYSNLSLPINGREYLTAIASISSNNIHRNDKVFNKVIHHLNLAPILHRQIKELSLGQINRLKLAGTLLSSINKDLFCLDEPFSNLDSSSVKSFINLIKHEEFSRVSTLIVTHAWSNTNLFANMFTHVIHITLQGEVHSCSVQCINDELKSYYLFN